MTPETVALPEPWASEAQLYNEMAGQALGHAVAILAVLEGIGLEAIDDHRPRLQRAALAQLERIGGELVEGLRGPQSYLERMAVTYFFGRSAVGNVLRDFRQAAEPPAGTSLN